MTDAKKEKIIDALWSGLVTDGGHHKQYYLEKALGLLVTKKEFEDLRFVDEDGGQWIEGKSVGDKYEAWEPGIG